MLKCYYNREKLLEGIVEYIAVEEDYLNPQPEGSFLYEAETVFTGYPIIVEVDGVETLRPATTEELVELGQIVLKDTQEVVDGEIVDKVVEEYVPTFEEIKSNKGYEISAKFRSVQSTPVDVNGVFYAGGYNSVQKLDAERRLALEFGTGVTYYDVDSVGHDMSAEEALVVVAAVANAYKLVNKEYQGIMVKFNAATTEEELNAIDISFGL